MIEKKTNDFEIKAERAILVGLVRGEQHQWEVEDHLDELETLAGTVGAEVVDSFIQTRVAPDAAFFIGRGKLEELEVYIEMNEINLVIFDDELSPAQVKNIENIVKTKVIDRSSLILDIFADHAKSNEAKVQVELAQLNYLLPRLTRQWQHLSRQVGGIGTKGPGETQLETDRRLVRQRISHLKNRLEKIDSQNRTQRFNRQKIFRVALIGYTNAGKSTIMNALTKANVLTENKLFATLDTTVRRLELNKSSEVLISDTVGFIRKLPHHLVASFRTTLAESIEADLLCHVVDVSHQYFERHIQVVNELLDDLSIADKPRLLLFNKVDLLKKRGQGLLDQLRSMHPEAIFVSGKRQIGISNMRERLIKIIEDQYEIEQIRINYKNGTGEHLIHALAKVLDKKYDENYIYLKIKYPTENRSKIFAIAEKFQES